MSTTISTLVRALSVRLDRLARYFVARAAISHLHQLDDWALNDIGLARAEIKNAVRGS